jgi:hypothetical protein
MLERNARYASRQLSRYWKNIIEETGAQAWILIGQMVFVLSAKESIVSIMPCLLKTLRAT